MTLGAKPREETYRGVRAVFFSEPDNGGVEGVGRDVRPAAVK